MPRVVAPSLTASSHLSGLDQEPPIVQCYRFRGEWFYIRDSAQGLIRVEGQRTSALSGICNASIGATGYREGLRNLSYMQMSSDSLHLPKSTCAFISSLGSFQLLSVLVELPGS